MQHRSSYIEEVSPIQEQAEELMNSLFSDVEQALSIDLTTDNLTANLAGTELTKYKPEKNFQQSEISSLHSSSFSRVESAIAIIPKPIKHTAKYNSIELAPQKIKTERVRLPELEPKSNQNSSPSKSSETVGFIDTLLLGSALTSAIFAVALGLLSRKPVYTPAYTNSNSQIQNNDSLVAESLRRSLYEIPTNNATKPTDTNTASNIINPVIDTSSQVKPIYIPIYQPTQPNVPVLSDPPTLKTKTVVSAIAPSPVFRDKRSDKKSSYTLIGVLELGDRSTAIIDINGSIQSLKIGSVVADSGWTIGRIAQQEMILKRGNEDTTVSVGQKF